MGKLNNLSLELLGKDKHIARMIGVINSFRAKLVLWISHLKMKSLARFPSMKHMLGDSEIDLSTFVINLQFSNDLFYTRIMSEEKLVKPITVL